MESLVLQETDRQHRSFWMVWRNWNIEDRSQLDWLFVMAMLTCVAGAAFYPRIISWYSNQFGQHRDSWMEKGGVTLSHGAKVCAEWSKLRTPAQPISISKLVSLYRRRHKIKRLKL